MQHRPLDIVIVNWNAGPQLQACLTSISESDDVRTIVSSLVVVDNASQDGSANGLTFAGGDLRVLSNSRNLGFGVGCNQGAAACAADYILFLNPDTILSPECLKAALAFMSDARHANVGVCGIQLVGKDGGVWRSCARFPNLRSLINYSLGLDRLFPRHFHTYFMDDWPHDSSRVVDHVIGAFYLVRRSLFERLGGFDQRFFMYLEDLDFSKRLHDSGWLIQYLATVRAFHEGGGTSSRIKADRLFYSLRSRLQYAFKHLGWIRGGVVMVCALFVEPVIRLLGAAVTRSSGQVRDTLRAYVSLWRSIPALVGGLIRPGHVSAETARRGVSREA
jgi:GT2 family glycosyltransferase